MPHGVFLDTSFFVALANERDRDHKQMVALFDRIRKGEFGQPYTSDYVFDESISTTMIRTSHVDRAIKVGRMILGYKEEEILPIARLVHVDESVFSKAWENFSSAKLKDKKILSFTDHTILVQMKDLDVDTIASMNSGFDAFVSRIF